MTAGIPAARETAGEASGEQIGWDGETAEQMKLALAKACGLRAAGFVCHIVAIILQAKREMQALFERENRMQFFYRLALIGKARPSGLLHAR